MPHTGEQEVCGSIRKKLCDFNGSINECTGGLRTEEEMDGRSIKGRTQNESHKKCRSGREKVWPFAKIWKKKHTNKTQPAFQPSSVSSPASAPTI